MPTKDLKVVIVGGSIAGLLLANALARQGIDFIVLEGRSEVAPCDGAGLCILSSGARILDQLGIFEDIKAYGGPISVQRIWRDDGQLLGHTETLALIPVRYVESIVPYFTRGDPHLFAVMTITTIPSLRPNQTGLSCHFR